MSIAAATLITALRAACIAWLAVHAAARGVRAFRGLRASVSGASLWLMLLTLLVPSMVLGYRFATSRALAGGWAAELLYSTLVLMRIVPLAFILVWVSPPSWTPQSSHSFALMGRTERHRRWLWQLRGWWGEMATVFCVVFLFAFQEFDLAACMNARSWTVALFDAQAGGLALGESLRLMLWPLAVECAVLGTLVFRARNHGQRTGPEAPSNERGIAPFLLLLIIAELFFLFAGPVVVLGQGLAGIPALWGNFALAREVQNSFVLALVTSIAAWLLAGWAIEKRMRIAVIALPGLLGGLLVSLLLLALFQVPPLHLLRASPLPVLVALVLTLMPAALFVRHILACGLRSESAHAATLNGGMQARWRVLKRPALWGGAVLFLQAYGDFTANSLLAPPALTSAFSRIFNLMHYGQTAALSAMLLVTLAVPLLALFIAMFIARRVT